jgi:hypothetical protein
MLLPIDLIFEQAKGYVKAIEKSTSRVLSWREVFEPARGMSKQAERA